MAEPCFRVGAPRSREPGPTLRAGLPASGGLPGPDPRGARTRHRIFVAIPLDPALREASGGVRSLLGPEAHKLRWVAAENLHLTLRFLGEITVTEVARVAAAAQEAAAATAPFSITLAGVGAFPSLRSPRILWVGVTEGADHLAALAGSLEGALGARKFPREPRGFHPHLTVARARSVGGPPDLGVFAGRLQGPGAPLVGAQAVDSLVVMESTLRPSGPVYQEVARAQLCGPGEGRATL